MSFRSRYVWLTLTALLLATAVSLWEPVTAFNLFLTTRDPFITLDPGVPEGSEVQAIINSGDEIDGFVFEGIPDGIGLAPGPRRHTVNVFVAHEQTTVPFFGRADFQNASVSKLTLSTKRPNLGAVLDASVALPPSAGFLRFCSAFMAGPREGFRRYTFFTGEEANDVVDVVSGAPYGPDPALTPQRQAGYAVALDVQSGRFTHIPGLGRLNHENTIVVPGGWRATTLLTTDDTFSGPSAQLYMYLARRDSHVLMDRGTLWAFRVTETDVGTVDPADPFNGANDYLDLQPGDDWKGQFIPVPRDIALGTTGDAPQDALENWSNDNNVFQFIRLEDLAYDKNDPRVVYVADTGRTRVIPDPATGRMTRGPGGTTGFADKGRIFKLVFNKSDPREVDSFSVLADADVSPDSPVFVAMTNPDNMDTSRKSLMVQEDADNAKIWQYKFATGTWRVVATVNDPDGESSGIVDARDWFGPGWWVLDVQGHGMNVKEEMVGDVLLKRESGQLLLMKIPGS